MEAVDLSEIIWRNSFGRKLSLYQLDLPKRSFEKKLRIRTVKIHPTNCQTHYRRQN